MSVVPNPRNNKSKDAQSDRSLGKVKLVAGLICLLSNTNWEKVQGFLEVVKDLCPW